MLVSAQSLQQVHVQLQGGCGFVAKGWREKQDALLCAKAFIILYNTLHQNHQVLYLEILCRVWQINIPCLLYWLRQEQQESCCLSSFHMVPFPCNIGSQRNDNIAAITHWIGYHIHIGSYAVRYIISSLDDRLHPC